MQAVPKATSDAGIRSSTPWISSIVISRGHIGRKPYVWIPRRLREPARPCSPARASGTARGPGRAREARSRGGRGDRDRPGRRLQARRRSARCESRDCTRAPRPRERTDRAPRRAAPVQSTRPPPPTDGRRHPTPISPRSVSPCCRRKAQADGLRAETTKQRTREHRLLEKADARRAGQRERRCDRVEHRATWAGSGGPEVVAS